MDNKIRIQPDPNETIKIPLWVLWYATKYICDRIVPEELDKLIDALAYKTERHASRVYYNIMHDSNQSPPVRAEATRRYKDAQREINSLTDNGNIDPLELPAGANIPWY